MKAKPSFPFCSEKSFCLQAMQTRPWAKTSAYANLFLHGVLLTSVRLCVRHRSTKEALFSEFSESRALFRRTLPQIPLSSFHFTEQAGWNCLSALRGELELMLWKHAVVFPWNTDIFSLQCFDVSFKNKQANAISIFLHFWCFSKRSLFSLG